MFSTGQILGFLTVVFVLLSMHRMMIRVSAPYTDKLFVKFPKFLQLKRSMAKILVKYHPIFAFLAMVFAVVHAAYNFVLTQAPSFTGASIIILLGAQMVIGNLVKTNKSLVWLHRLLPFLGLFALIIHIIQK